MHTLIELYDERAIENVIGPETFKPRHIIYLCPNEVKKEGLAAKALSSFFARHGYHPTLEFIECSLYKADYILSQMLNIKEKYPDCALDVTGGTDAALIAAGMFCQKTGTPTFTYSRKRNRFYDISNADFADDLLCKLVYSVPDFFTMTGGMMRKGRIDNIVLDRHLDSISDFFKIFLDNRREWVSFILYMQTLTASPDDDTNQLSISGDFIQKCGKNRRIPANIKILSALQNINYIKDLEYTENETISFIIADDCIRWWLRDVGSALEVYIYKICHESGIFNDVVSSCIVDWNRYEGNESVSNEIDVVAARGITPLFISCKATAIKTEALNELAILRDRFGGKGAKSVIVTSEKCNAAARHRATQLGITVIDLEELKTGNLIGRNFL